jgi:hypothetical protein
MDSLSLGGTRSPRILFQNPAIASIPFDPRFHDSWNCIPQNFSFDVYPANEIPLQFILRIKDEHRINSGEVKTNLSLFLPSNARK